MESKGNAQAKFFRAVSHTVVLTALMKRSKLQVNGSQKDFSSF